jgi:spore coat polysaccharide biosynthesis protein SpsF
VLATTTNPQDDVLELLAKEYNIFCFRGSEEDVMSRVLGAGKMAKADIIVEITGDCPLIDPNIVEHSIQMFLANKVDYLTNALQDTYPVGMATQVFPLKILEKSYNMTDDPLDREHVTRHICTNPTLFSHLQLIAPPDCTMGQCEITLDELADYELIKNIIEYFGKGAHFSCQDIIHLLRNVHPEWLLINKHVNRRGLDD